MRSSRGSSTLPSARPPSAGSPRSTKVHSVDGAPDTTAPTSPAFSAAWSRIGGRLGSRALNLGVIFDCDGTLVDSEPISAEAWRRTVAPYGFDPMGIGFDASNRLYVVDADSDRVDIFAPTN